MSSSLNGPPQPRPGLLEIQNYVSGMSATVSVDEIRKFTMGGEEANLCVVEALPAFVEGSDRG